MKNVFNLICSIATAFDICEMKGYVLIGFHFSLKKEDLPASLSTKNLYLNINESFFFRKMIGLKWRGSSLVMKIIKNLKRKRYRL